MGRERSLDSVLRRGCCQLEASDTGIGGHKATSRTEEEEANKWNQTKSRLLGAQARFQHDLDPKPSPVSVPQPRPLH
jgi:hypothetical protein